MTLEGYDISSWQATTPSLTGKAFCIARAGYGTSTVDTKYAYHAANIRAAGVVLGAYWFLYLGQDNATAVKTFLATAGSADLLFLDVEGGANNATGYALASDFIAKVHAAGRKIGLYHSLSGYPKLGQDFNWVALWSSTPPSIPWTFWQYGGSGIDADRFNGDAAALAALVGDNMPALTTYTPGYVATVKSGRNVRKAPSLTAGVIRVTSTVETWTVVGFVTGDVDPEDGSNQWLVRWNANQWEYTTHANLATQPGPPPDTSPYTQAQLDAAKQTGYTSGYADAKTKATSAVSAI